MAGFFDDLIPQQSAPSAPAAGGGYFDDLIPSQGNSSTVVPPTPGRTVLTVRPNNLAQPDAAPVSAPVDFARSIPGGIVGGLSSAMSAGGQAAQAEMGQPIDVPDAATTKGLFEQNITGQLPEPQGRAGRFGNAVGEFIGNPSSYIAPGSLPLKIGMAAVGGLGSEAGGQLAEGTPYEMPARILGGAIGAGGFARATQPARVAAEIGAKPSGAAPGIERLKEAYEAIRNSPEVKTAVVPIQDVKSLARSAEKDLISQGFRPTTASAPSTFAELNHMTPPPPPELTPLQRLQAEMNWETIPEPPQVKQATMDDILAARRAFGKTAQQKNPFPIGGSTPDAAASQDVMRKLDSLIEQHAPQMREANANYSAAKTSEKFDKRVQKAEMSAEAANSGMNIGNRIRQSAVQLLSNDKALLGFKPDEIEKLHSIVSGTAGRNTIRWFSNVLGGGGGLGAVVTGGIASHVLGPIGWALSPVGHVLKHIENSMTLRQANELSEMIRARSPVGQAITNAAQDWDKARDALVSGPSSAKFAAFSLASRNLSNNLASAGVKVHPNQLIRAVQGPVDSDANEKKQ